jgi:hypothetical protein
MNRKIETVLLMVLLVFPIAPVFSQTTKEIIIQKNDPEYGEIEKIIESYDSNNKCIRQDVYPTAALSGKIGIKRQVIFINDGIINKYEMYYTDEKIKETNCKQALEYMNHGQVSGVKYIFVNNETLELTGDTYAKFGKMPVRRLDYYAKNVYKKPSNAKELLIELLPGIANVSITNDTVELSKSEKALLRDATMNLFRYDFSSEFKYKIKVVEDEKIFFLIMTEEEIKQYKNSQARKAVSYYYIGGDIYGAVFFAVKVF